MSSLDYTTRAIRHTLIGGMFGLLVTQGSILIGLKYGWIEKVNVVEYLAVLTSYTCTYLCVMQIRWQYILAIISTSLYMVLFFGEGLYGSALANLYLPIAIIYGWFRWGSDKDTRSVSWTKPHYYPAYIGLGLGGWGVTYYVADLLGYPIPALDSVILVLTIIAQFLMDNKKLENWIVWSVLNIVAIYLYFNSGLFLAGVQYLVFLGNTVFGFIMWYRSKPVVTDNFTDHYNGLIRP